MTSGAVEILYRDDRTVAVSKPGGMLVHRTHEADEDGPFLLQEVRELAGAKVYPVHRLDRPTSGLVLFALSPEATRAWQEALARPTTEKRYLAMVRGRTPDGWSSFRPLTSDRGVRRNARTTFETLVRFGGFSLLTVRLHTGRRHQIRRHLAHCAHQVVGDSSYGKGGINRYLREEHGLPRLFLHARSLSIVHPETNERLRIDCPLAEDLSSFLERYPDFPSESLAEM